MLQRMMDKTTRVCAISIISNEGRELLEIGKRGIIRERERGGGERTRTCLRGNSLYIRMYMPDGSGSSILL